jgi:hypothetical protein
MKDRTMLFNPGRLLMTPGVRDLLESTETDPMPIIEKHLTGDWGTVCEDDAKANDHAVEHGARILSAYEIDGEKIWIITEADRSATTILLPSEY